MPTTDYSMTMLDHLCLKKPKTSALIAFLNGKGDAVQYSDCSRSNKSTTYCIFCNSMYKDVNENVNSTHSHFIDLLEYHRLRPQP